MGIHCESKTERQDLKSWEPLMTEVHSTLDWKIEETF